MNSGGGAWCCGCGSRGRRRRSDKPFRRNSSSSHILYCYSTYQFTLLLLGVPVKVLVTLREYRTSISKFTSYGRSLLSFVFGLWSSWTSGDLWTLWTLCTRTRPGCMLYVNVCVIDVDLRMSFSLFVATSGFGLWLRMEDCAQSVEMMFVMWWSGSHADFRAHARQQDTQPCWLALDDIFWEGKRRRVECTR